MVLHFDHMKYNSTTLFALNFAKTKKLHMKQRGGGGPRSSRDILRQRFYWIIGVFAFCTSYEIQFNNTVCLVFCKSQEPSYEAERRRKKV